MSATAFLYDRSIRSKLTASSVVVATIALVLACAAFIFYDRFTFREALVRKLSSQAEIVGLNSVSALLFNDADAATSTLKALRAEPRIVSAAIYAKDGKLFARFSPSDDARDAPPPALSAAELANAYGFDGGRVRLFRRILSDDEPVGVVYLEADLAEMDLRTQRYAGIAGLVLAVSLAAAMIVSFRLQRIIAEPILHLAATARTISAEKNYSVRAEKERGDETGILVEAFNDMLAQIQDRDRALTLEIAERRRAEADLERARDAALEASRLKSAFLANMSHEIRTPLNVILGYNALIEDHLNEIGDDSQRPLIEAVQRGSSRLLNTVHGILDMSKIETGNFEIHPKPIALSRFLEREVAEYRKLAEQKRLFLTLKVDTADAVVTFDEYCLANALKNLLDNAIKFTDEGGVFVRLGRDRDGHLRLDVRDTGIGIEPAYLPRLYDSFSQEHSGSTRPFEGSGLGMALTKRFLEINGTTISVASEKSKGSTFSIHFPTELETSDPPRPRPVTTAGVSSLAAVRSPSSPTPPRVLLVEDDADSQRLMKALLRDRYEVVCAASGAEVRAQLARDGADVALVLMDLSLRGEEDGLSLTRFLRSRPGWAATPIVAVTAHVQTEDQQSAMEAGCTAFLAKPIQKNELYELTDRLLGSVKRN